jgi:hypothetical protein
LFYRALQLEKGWSIIQVLFQHGSPESKREGYEEAPGGGAEKSMSSVNLFHWISEMIPLWIIARSRQLSLLSSHHFFQPKLFES